jgi:predicted glycoside hydrolase/deacetylase ChbG (UPF0249 family)
VELSQLAGAADTAQMVRSGALIVNADDWGRDRENTDRILECILGGFVSSTSAMVFMEDSERSATLAREKGVDAGLHLNLTSQFSAPRVSERLQEHQRRVSHYLLRHRLAPIMFHPGLSNSFRYLVVAQLEEYQRLYGNLPARIDGHHHMHLSANVVLSKLLPPGAVVRRNFTFRRGEKGYCNRLYRSFLDKRLQKRHPISDFMFALPPLNAERLQGIFSLAREFVVEVECHPVYPEEYRFLMEGGIQRLAADIQIAREYALAKTDGTPKSSRSTSNAKDRLTALPCALAFGATVYASLMQLSEYL